MSLSTSRIVRRIRFPCNTAHNLQRAQSTTQPQRNGDKFSSFSDPYPLPLSSTALVSHPPETLDPLPPPIERNDESLQTLRARLVYQSRKRGTLEADLLLSTFAGEHLRHMDEAELREFDKLMDEPDWDIYYWAIGKRDPPARWIHSSLFAKLRTHAANEGKVVRRMPDLSTSPK
ncbi:Flavinator of succinate dehydrogenase-domain-containing protein [Gautieria morchelliformis]|nr:Flavinator of succinate dehydrogenase-domain-containing protein [Gautieria morchelliformis]